MTQQLGQALALQGYGLFLKMQNCGPKLFFFLMTKNGGVQVQDGGISGGESMVEGNSMKNIDHYDQQTI